jgi:hypothetical protein
VVEPNDATHCLQSLEESGAAQIEGFAQFYAAKAWNREEQSDCVRAYNKNFLDGQCKPGAAGCIQYASDLWISQPPFPLDCATPVKWRNTNCVNAQSSPDALSQGVELDWMGFFWAVNTTKDPTYQPWSMPDLFSLYGVKPADCGGSLCRYTWSGAASSVSLAQRADTVAGGPDTPKAQAFRGLADTYGVDDTP